MLQMPKATKRALEFTYENPQLEVEADRNRIRQVLTNLMDNAIAYSEEGSVKRPDAAPPRQGTRRGGRHGPGHPERAPRPRVRAFLPRRHGALAQGGRNRPRARDRPADHGGARRERSHVESTKGRGTRFWFELPARRSGRGERRRLPSRRGGPERGLVDGGAAEALDAEPGSRRAAELFARRRRSTTAAEVRELGAPLAYKPAVPPVGRRGEPALALRHRRARARTATCNSFSPEDEKPRLRGVRRRRAERGDRGEP